jgi:hypothetical protein
MNRLCERKRVRGRTDKMLYGFSCSRRGCNEKERERGREKEEERSERKKEREKVVVQLHCAAGVMSATQAALFLPFSSCIK